STSTLPTFDTSTQPLNFNLNLSQPTFTQTIIDESNCRNKLKHPKYIDQLRIKSDAAIRSYNSYYYNFHLPAAADYSQNFHLQSNYLFKGFKDSMMQVDCLNNYIESITLNINNTENVISRIDG